MIDHYIWRNKHYDSKQVDEISKSNNISKMMSKLLINRKMINKDNIKKFLNPDIKDFFDPFLLDDMDKAVNRIIIAKNNNEKITVYGDYDVDGITSTSILIMFLRELGINCDYYLPNRLEEGYGVNEDAIRKISSDNTNLLITVDTGITAVKEVEIAIQLNIDVIVTDHHEVQDELPNCIAVIDPKRRDSKYPFSELAGVGVTFKLINALALKLDCMEIIWKYLDLVAIGTVADIVPLVNENRIIVKHAYETIKSTWNKGLHALLDVVGYKPHNKITSGLIGFGVAPRLNAAGRLGDARKGVELFTTTDLNKAKEIAKHLDDENKKRQILEQEIYEQALDIINSSSISKDKIIVLAKEGWHHGVIGIVSSRITEKFYRPSILLAIDKDKGTGSARSIEGFNIFKALKANSNYLDKYGGHEMAAGLSINVNKIDEFRLNINKYADELMDNEMLTPKIYIDDELSNQDITLECIEEINKLQPYGMGNSEPLFLYSNTIESYRLIGKMKNHLKLILSDNNFSVDAVGFDMGNFTNLLIQDQDIPVNVVGKLNINEWNNIKKPQLILKDIKQNINFNLDTNVPNRDDFAALYRTLKSFSKINKYIVSINEIIVCLYKKYSIKMNNIKLLNCLKIFEELYLIKYINSNSIIEFNLLKFKKVNLSDSKILNSLINDNKYA